MMTSAPSRPALPPSTDGAGPCVNCGHTVVEDYCAACGQKTAPFQRPIYHLGREVVADYFGFDGKLWRTLVPLLVRPGFLTREYLDGRRNRYVRPMRLYLTASVLLFFLISVLPEGGVVQFQDRSGTATDSLAAVRAATLEPVAGTLAEAEAELAALDSVRAVLVAARDSLQATQAVDLAANGQPPPVGDTTGGLWGPFGEVMGQKGERLGAMGEEGAERWFIKSFTSSMPKAMFVLLPIFALLLKLLYVRRERYYGEHLVFALHTHAFAFIVFAALALFVAATGGAESLDGAPKVIVGSFSLVLIGVVPAYVLFALRRVYGQSWAKTVAKGFVLMSAYGLALVAGLVAVIIVAFLLL